MPLPPNRMQKQALPAPEARICCHPFLAGIRAAQKIVNGVEEPDDIFENGTPEEISTHVKEAIAQVDGKGLIIGPGCVVNQFVTEEKLRAVQHALAL